MFADRPASMKIKTTKKWTKVERKLMMSLRARTLCTNVNKMVLYSLSAIWMVAIKKNQPPAVQNTNETVRDGPKMSHQLVGVWSEHPAFCENKNPENFFWRVSTLFHENLHQRKFPAIQYLARNAPPILDKTIPTPKWIAPLFSAAHSICVQEIPLP